MIGVCIKFFHANYGGMLQACATVAFLEELGIDYELIQYQKKLTFREKIKSIPRLLNGVLLNDKYEALVKKIGEKKHPSFAAKNLERLQAFKAFNQAHFSKLSPVFVGYAALCQGARRYNAVLSGSDQLWSPAGLPTNYYNLQFVPQEIRKVSWSSSFGVSEIPWYQKKRTKDYLQRIEYISMRENRGAQIIEELTGREVPVLMDPVFAFGKDEWNKLIPEKTVDWDDYIFCYFLGDNPVHRATAKKLAEKTGRKIVTLRHMDQYVAADEYFGDVAPYDVAPDRFLDILRNASAVCTDSFHGMAFSIIFEKQFVVFDRYSTKAHHSKNSRIDSLCANLDLGGRRYSGESDISQKMESSIPYDAIREKLLAERIRTKQYLETALK